MLIGYMRPYENDLTCEKQLKKLQKFNCQLIISEDHSSAKKRVQLKNMLNTLNLGDKIIVTKLFTLADSTRHLVEILEILDVRGAYFQSIDEKIDTSNRNGYSFGEILKHLVKFQSDVISDKTKKGLYKAKQKGISPGRPKKADENVQRAILMYQSKKYTLSQIKDETGISKSTLYRYLEH
ncbi:resolvase [Clostridium butyricum]|jgi:DNA invertase Pin-like site-specific DNA recombinase|uniref:Resolvase n=1 Tax=Clostridium butyricum TaxID=1492 RepID=A0A512TT31_CLOBU|nr:recombinase family protein [Clostridium butyricum]NOW21612.1 DNA invertase Pin-like site-specific DNA recombinase [Clostridium butyricum]GEQ23416.1 resolvase [Clostridium butyricum]